MQESLNHQSSQKIQIESIYPLSPMQQGMLFHTLQAPESGVYFVQSVFTLCGRLDIAAFERAWQRVVERHSVLRTLFKWENGKNPLQVVCKSVTLPWTNCDWRSLTPTEQQEHLEQLLQTERMKGFELDKAPLMRCTLIQVADGTYQLVWSNHHLLLDGWCLPIILKEVFAFYEAFSRGDDLHFDASLPYRNYINWLRQQDSSASERFWRHALHGFTAPTPLIVDKPGRNALNPRQTYDIQEVRLSATVTDALKSLVRQHHLTLNTVIQGAWALLLSRYSGESDVVFGVTVSGRPPALTGVESMVGLFINTLPMRVQLTETAQVLPWLQQLQAQHIEQDRYSYSALTEIQGWSSVPRGTPLFESILVFENYPDSSSLSESTKDIQIKDIEGFERTNYPLTVMVVPQQELLIQISYDTDRFDAGTIARTLGHLQTLLESIVAYPDQRITELSLLTKAEHHQSIFEWNNTKTKYPQDKCIHQLFEEQVELNPDAVAVVFEGERLTYRELNHRANQLARHLHSLGIKPEVLVGICVERSLKMVVGLLGILKAGGAYVPLDPSYPQERLSYMLSDSGVDVLLTQQSLSSQLPKYSARVVCLDTDWTAIAQNSYENFDAGVSKNNVAYVIYTSGSTGQPKGVQIEHQSLSNFLNSMMAVLGLTPEDTFNAVTTISFDIAALELYLPLVIGAKVIVVSREIATNADLLLSELIESKSTVMQATPATWQMLLTQGWSSNYPLKVLCGGEALPTQLTYRILETGSELWNLYGPTEATVWATSYQVRANKTVAKTEDTISLIGRAIANTQIYILDHHRQPVPIGIAGEIYIGGDGLARGYLNRPELTAEKFISNPFSNHPNSRLYKTGDLARYLPDGNIEFLGRIDHQVKIRGFRIELGEIESALNQHPEVREATVVAREDKPGDKRLVAYITSNLVPDRLTYQSECLLELDGHTFKLQTADISSGGVGVVAAPMMAEGTSIRLRLLLPSSSQTQWFDGQIAWSKSAAAGIKLHLTPAEQIILDCSLTHLQETQGLWKTWQRTIAQSLRNYLKGKLPDYTIPSAFVLLDTMPLTPNGKIDRRALPAPDRIQPQQEKDFVLPSTPTENSVAAIWCEVLGLSQVSIHDNFFELGGHSLLSIQIISRVCKAFSIDLSISNLFESPTIAAFSHAIDTHSANATQSSQQIAIASVSRDTAIPLSFSQFDLWYLEQQCAGDGATNMQLTWKLSGNLSPTILEKALNQIVGRHEILRTTFPIVDGSPLQQIAAILTIPLEIVSLWHLPLSDRKLAAEKIMHSAISHRFDLATAPLIKTILVQISDEEHWLLILMHHIISDGWSCGIFMEELEALYDAFSTGKSSPLPELPCQYADFTVWERNYFSEEVVSAHMTYWHKHLANLPSALDLLPEIEPSPANHCLAAEHALFLPVSLTDKIATFSHTHGVTPYVILLTALKILLCKWSGRSDSLVLATLANRNRLEIEKLIGCFINDLPICSQIDPDETGVALLARIQQAVTGALMNPLPVEKIWQPYEDKVQVLRTVNFTLVPGIKWSHRNFKCEELIISSDRGLWNDRNFPLELYVSYPAETNRAIEFCASYSTSTFTTETIECFLQGYQAILDRLLQYPETIVADFPQKKGTLI
jgi:amino acid adenylation domain-containing protein